MYISHVATKNYILWIHAKYILHNAEFLISLSVFFRQEFHSHHHRLHKPSSGGHVSESHKDHCGRTPRTTTWVTTHANINIWNLIYIYIWIASRTCKRKVVGSNLRSGRDCWWGEYPPSIPRLRCPWARHRTPNCSPGAVTWLPTAPGVCSLRMG